MSSRYSITRNTSLSQSYLSMAKKVGWAKIDQIDKIKQKFLEKYVVGDTVLDLGCGSGAYTDYLTQKFFLKQIFGMDHNQILLKTAQKRGISNFIKADALDTGLKDKSIDTTILFDLLEHLPEREALTEVIRITKRRIIFCVPRTTDEALSKNFLLFGHHIDPTHLRTYSIHEIEDLLHQYHLKRVIIRKTHPVSTDSILFELFDGNTYVKKALRKLSLLLLKKRTFYSNLIAVADLD